MVEVRIDVQEQSPLIVVVPDLASSPVLNPPITWWQKLIWAAWSECATKGHSISCRFGVVTARGWPLIEAHSGVKTCRSLPSARPVSPVTTHWPKSEP